MERESGTTRTTLEHPETLNGNIKNLNKMIKERYLWEKLLQRYEKLEKKL